MGVRARPAGVDQYPFTVCHFPAHDFEHLFLFGEQAGKIAAVLWLDDDLALKGVDDFRLVVGLIGINRQQVQVCGKDLLRRLAVGAKNLLQGFFRFLVAPMHIIRHF